MVYIMCIGGVMRRTNIVLDEKLINKGKKLTGLKTCKDLVDFALKQLLRHENQKKILNLEGRIEWSGNLAKMRATRGTK